MARRLVRRTALTVFLSGITVLAAWRYLMLAVFIANSTPEHSEVEEGFVVKKAADLPSPIDRRIAIKDSYIGCWIETMRKDFQPTERWHVGDKTLAECSAVCARKGFAFAAMKTGKECICEMDIMGYRPAAINNCVQLCPGDFMSVCGGTFAASIYFIGNQEKRTNASKVHILAYHRTGSSFVGEIFRRYPGSFYIYEPFWPLAVDGNSMRCSDCSQQAAVAIGQLLNCQFFNLSPTFLFRLRRFISDKRLYTDYDPISKFIQCTNAYADQREKISSMACIQLLKFYCEKSKLRIVKTVRLQLNSVTELLNGLDPGVKTIHLVRDPRPTLISQERLQLLVGGFVTDGIAHCTDMSANMIASQRLSLEDKFYFLRYEDLAERPVDVTRSLYRFVDVEPEANLSTWLKSVTQSGARLNIGYVGPLKVDARYKASEWKLYFKSKTKELTYIQKHCSKAMEMCGYKVIDSSQLGNINLPTTENSSMKFMHTSMNTER